MLNREELVERVRGIIAEAALCSNDECLPCIQAARAALAVIEPVVREACMKAARNACLVPPDGGSPTEGEVACCDAMEAAIRGGSNAG